METVCVIYVNRHGRLRQQSIDGAAYKCRSLYWMEPGIFLFFVKMGEKLVTSSPLHAETQ